MRRTDKVGTEAAFHALDEYMREVDFYFITRELLNSTQAGSESKRVVYLATDELAVMNEAESK